MPVGNGTKEQASALSRSGGLEMAGTGVPEAIHTDAVCMGGDAVGHSGTVFPLEGFERPMKRPRRASDIFYPQTRAGRQSLPSGMLA